MKAIAYKEPLQIDHPRGHALSEQGGSTRQVGGGLRESAVAQNIQAPGFEPINRGYDSVFRSGRLSLGLVVPLEE